MTKAFLNEGEKFTPINKDMVNVVDTLPSGVYAVQVTPLGQFYLSLCDNLTLPSKLYGDTEKLTDRVINTFLDRPNNSGILLSGDKGSGKTLLSKNIASKLQKDKKYITILVNSEYYGENFNTFLQNIAQPAVVIFDEFEKTYERKNQQHLLTILDGVYTSKKLFILTCNDQFNIDIFMLNRPGRLFYALKFGGLSADFISDYAKDTLKNMDHLNSILGVSKFFSKFSFDMLKAIVEEMNRYNESADEAIQYLNMNPEDDSHTPYEAYLLRNGAPLLFDQKYAPINGSPLAMNTKGMWFGARDLDDEETDKYAPNEITTGVHLTIDVSKLKEVKSNGFDYIFDTEVPNLQLAFKKKDLYKLDYKSF